MNIETRRAVRRDIRRRKIKNKARRLSMTTIAINKPVPEEFLSDILITAFDGQYGSSWMWFAPAGHPTRECKANLGEDQWLVTKHSSGHTSSDNPWMEAHVCVNGDYVDDVTPLARENMHIVVDHEAIANGISRILNDDYVDVWRTANEREAASIVETYGRSPLAFGELEGGEVHGREWRRNPESRMVLQVHTGETARGLKPTLAQAVLELEAGDIDASLADAIVQAAVFGKVIFG